MLDLQKRFQNLRADSPAELAEDLKRLKDHFTQEELYVVVAEDHAAQALESLFGMLEKPNFVTLSLWGILHIYKLQSGNLSLSVASEKYDCIGLAKQIKTCISAKSANLGALSVERIKGDLPELKACDALTYLSISVDSLPNGGRSGMCPASRLEKLSLSFERQTTPIYEVLTVALHEQANLEELAIKISDDVDLSDPLQLQHVPSFVDAVNEHSCLTSLRLECTKTPLSAKTLVPLFKVVGKIPIKAFAIPNSARVDYDDLLEALNGLKDSVWLESLSLGNLVVGTERVEDRHDGRIRHVWAALEGNTSISHLHCSNPWAEWPCLNEVLRSNQRMNVARRFLAKDYEKIKSNPALLPHLLANLGSNKDYPTPLHFFLLRVAADMMTTEELPRQARKRKASNESVESAA